MYNILLIISFIIGIASICSIIYAPFARSWLRAIIVSFGTTFAWSALRIAMTIFFKEPDSPPLMGFIVLPFFIAVYAVIARSIKILICKIIAICVKHFSRNKKENE